MRFRNIRSQYFTGKYSNHISNSQQKLLGRFCLKKFLSSIELSTPYHTPNPKYSIFTVICSLNYFHPHHLLEFILLKDHSIFTDEIYFLQKEIHLDENITWVKNFSMWGKNIVIPHHQILSTWKTSIKSLYRLLWISTNDLLFNTSI